MYVRRNIQHRPRYRYAPPPPVPVYTDPSYLDPVSPDYPGLGSQQQVQQAESILPSVGQAVGGPIGQGIGQLLQLAASFFGPKVHTTPGGMTYSVASHSLYDNELVINQLYEQVYGQPLDANIPPPKGSPTEWSYLTGLIARYLGQPSLQSSNPKDYDKLKAGRTVRRRHPIAGRTRAATSTKTAKQRRNAFYSGHGGCIVAQLLSLIGANLALVGRWCYAGICLNREGLDPCTFPGRKPQYMGDADPFTTLTPFDSSGSGGFFDTPLPVPDISYTPTDLVNVAPSVNFPSDIAIPAGAPSTFNSLLPDLTKILGPLTNAFTSIEQTNALTAAQQAQLRPGAAAPSSGAPFSITPYLPYIAFGGIALLAVSMLGGSSGGRRR